jgi:hypothetical protein
MPKTDANLRRELTAENVHLAAVFAKKAAAMTTESEIETQPARRAFLSEVSKIFDSLSIHHARLAQQEEIEPSLQGYRSGSVAPGSGLTGEQ